MPPLPVFFDACTVEDKDRIFNLIAQCLDTWEIEVEEFYQAFGGLPSFGISKAQMARKFASNEKDWDYVERLVTEKRASQDGELSATDIQRLIRPAEPKGKERATIDEQERRTEAGPSNRRGRRAGTLSEIGDEMESRAQHEFERLEVVEQHENGHVATRSQRRTRANVLPELEDPTMQYKRNPYLGRHEQQRARSPIRFWSWEELEVGREDVLLRLEQERRRRRGDLGPDQRR